MPFKGGENCKSRLATVLEHRQRFAIVNIMLERVLNALVMTGAITGRILLSSEKSQEFMRIAEANSFSVLRDNEEGLNLNVQRALEWARATGFRRALIISSDLPLILSSDIQGLIDAGRKYDAVLVPAKEETGTNVLLVPLEVDFSPSFGPDSCIKHLNALRCLRLNVSVYCTPGLCFDLDTPTDWLQWGKEAIGRL